MAVRACRSCWRCTLYVPWGCRFSQLSRCVPNNSRKGHDAGKLCRRGSCAGSMTSSSSYTELQRIAREVGTGPFFICGRTRQVRHLRRLESPLQTYYLTELLNRRAIRVRPHSCSRVRLRLSGSLLVEAALPVAGVPVTRLSHMIGRDLEGCGPFFFFSPLFAFPFVGMLGTQREAFG